MPRLNLNSHIEPGVAAAGFRIGETIESFADFDVRVVKDYPGLNHIQTIRENVGFLSIDASSSPRRFPDNRDTVIYYGPDTVRLVFTKMGVLGCIYLFAGYHGTYLGAAIGSPLAAISSLELLEFDDGDEMYYRSGLDGDYLPGLAIIAEEVGPEEHEKSEVLGFCVHDWTLFRNGG